MRLQMLSSVPLLSFCAPAQDHVTFSCKVPGKQAGEPLVVVISSELRITILEAQTTWSSEPRFCVMNRATSTTYIAHSPHASLGLTSTSL